MGETAVRLTCEELVRLRGQLIEGPCWDTRTESLLFVDIDAHVVYAMDWRSRGLESTELSESVSAVLPRTHGGEILACRRGLMIREETGAVRLALRLESSRPWSRTNDAKCDPEGRLWVGTMADDARPNGGRLYRLAADWQCTSVLDEVTISNGLGWSPDGRSMYYIDSATRRIDVFAYDVASGEATGRRSMVDTRSYPGLPDGMSVDAEGCIWVAFYGGAAVRRFSPDGELVGLVEVPTPRVTSCAFAGPELDHLVITTAKAGDAQVGDPGGDVYVTRTDVPGLPNVPFAA